MQGQVVARHTLATRIAHWLWALALLVLFLSGLQIFNAAPYLDASDKSDPAKRVLSIGAERERATGEIVGVTTVFGHPIRTTGVLGYTDDGMGGRGVRGFPGYLTLPTYQDLADGRHWHLFFGWALTLAMVVYFVNGAITKGLGELILRPSDLPKLLPMQLYYLHLRKEPPPHGKYNPLQKAAYTVVLFILLPLMILTGLALSPGIDAIAHPLTFVLGGRQFARLWHFAIMTILVLYFFAHMVLVLTTGVRNNIVSMITGRYRLRKYDGVGV